MANLLSILDTIFKSDYWAAVAAIFTAVASIGVVLVIRQLRFDAWDKMQKLFTGPDFVESRGLIYKRLDLEDPVNEPWEDEQKEAALEVCRRFDELAHLVPYLSLSSYHAKRLALKTWDDPTGKSWAIVKKVVKEEQKNCGWSHKWKTFENLGEQALRKLLNENRDDRLKKFVSAFQADN